jgi:hypothetical protein
MPDLKIMILRDQPDKIIEQISALLRSEPIDLLDVMSDSENALPTGDGVGPDNGMDCAQLSADILWGTSRSRMDFKVIGTCDLIKLWLGIGSCQRLEEFLVWLGDAIVDFVARRPKRVCSTYISLAPSVARDRELTSSGLGESCEPQDSVVARDGFKSDITMPLLAFGLSLWAGVVIEQVLIKLLRLFWINDADLVIFHGSFSSWVIDGVDMEFGGRRFAGELSKALGKDFLEVVVEGVLLTEEHDTALGDCR